MTRSGGAASPRRHPVPGGERSRAAARAGRRPPDARAARRCVTALCAGVAGIASVASGEPPPCFATAVLEPGRVVPGQQVLYRVRIASRSDVEVVEWSAALRFSGLRSEWLPGVPGTGAVERAGARYAVREERRALFAEQLGDVRLEAPALLCRAAGGAPVAVPVPEVALRVVPFPDEARPDGFRGLVGPIALRATVVPRRVSLGGTVRIALLARGAGNLWDLSDPLDGAARERLGDAEVFARRPRLDLEPGVRLGVRHHRVYDVVPRSEGELEVPEIRIPYWDPERGRYGEAVAPAVRVDVGPRAPPERAPPRAVAGGEREARRTSASGSVPGPLRWAALAAAGALGLGAVALVGRRRRRARGRVGEALARAARAREAGDPEAEASALARALREALCRFAPDALRTPAEELVARASLPPAAAQVAQQLLTLERSRFDPEAPPADARAIERVLADL